MTRDSQGPATSKIVINGVGATAFIGSGLSDTASTFLVLNKHGSSHASSIFGCSDGLLRWQCQLGNTLLESGGGSGSDFSLDRYNDSGVYVDSPIVVARSTGIVTVGNLNVLGGISAPISATNISASGTLSVGSTSTFTGVATFNASFGAQMRVAAGQIAEYRCVVAGQRDWGVGEYSAGYFRIADYTANVERFRIDSAGTVTIGGQLNVTGAVVSSTNVSINVAGGQNSLVWHLVAGVRQWFAGVDSSGNYQITDSSGGVNRLIIDTAGHCTINGALTCNSNFNTNQVSGTVFIASQYLQVASGAASATLYLGTNARQWSVTSSVGDGFLYFYDNSAGALRMYIETGGRVVYNGAIYVAGTMTVNGGSTLVGTISCNAISCSTITTNNNSINMGSGTLTVGTIDAFTCSGQINVSANGMAYNRLNGGAYFEFSSSGTQLTFYTNGVARGVWGFNSPSDERIKQNIGPAEGDALGELRGVKLISYDQTAMRDPKFQPTHLAFGFSAQQMQGAIPEAVNTVEAKDHPEIEDGLMLTLDILPLLARCIGAIQQLADRIEALEKRYYQWT